ncbi:hypothetical protein PV326_012650 [Microctonus aethiopoides]|nr:hypothetical protein PV326_012650 [Microctonus aethiopoides]
MSSDGYPGARVATQGLKNNKSYCLTIKDLHSVKRSIYAVKRKKFPTLPMCRADLHQDPETVGDFFAFQLNEMRPSHQQLDKFADYLVENYIEDDALFPPDIWAANTLSRDIWLAIAKSIATVPDSDGVPEREDDWTVL